MSTFGTLTITFPLCSVILTSYYCFEVAGFQLSGSSHIIESRPKIACQKHHLEKEITRFKIKCFHKLACGDKDTLVQFGKTEITL